MTDDRSITFIENEYEPIPVKTGSIYAVVWFLIALVLFGPIVLLMFAH